jgi:hypothetical protein
MEIYLTKSEMLARFKFPYFGITLYSTKEFFIRKDLPVCVQISVLAHENNHLERGYQGAFWKDEPPAWWAGLKAQPLGFFLGILLSLNPERLALYIERLRRNF